jgi:HAMP domain-containing protein
MRLLAKFNLILIGIFGVGGLLISLVAYNFLMGNARREVLAQAQLMMASATSVRDYTTSDLVPLLLQVPGHRVRFLAETVPAYGATTTFKNLRAKYPSYTYKEATLNPTNLEDRASDWEADVIRDMRDHPEQNPVVGERATPDGPSLYMARPIIVTHPCLECHSVPSAAPKAMLTVYGSANGFGWKENAVVGAQIVSVPAQVPTAIANQAFHRLLIYLVLTLVFTAIALDAGVYWLVIRPLRLVSATADRVSKGEKNVPPVAVIGSDEIAVVTASFNRMQLSLAKALAMLNKG